MKEVHIKGERKNFLKKILSFLLCNNIWERTFFSIVNFFFREKHEFYLFYYGAIFKDGVLFKQTQSSLETDVIALKKRIYFSKFVGKYVRLKWKKESYYLNNVLLFNYNYNYWICPNMPECA